MCIINQSKEHVQRLSSSLNGMQTELKQSLEREAEAQRGAHRAREELALLRSEEESWRREKEQVRGEGEQRRERLRQLEAELQQSRKTAKQGRAREQRLSRELLSVSDAVVMLYQ